MRVEALGTNTYYRRREGCVGAARRARVRSSPATRVSGVGTSRRGLPGAMRGASVLCAFGGCFLVGRGERLAQGGLYSCEFVFGLLVARA